MSAEVTTESVGVLGTLGVNWKLLLAQLVNFSIVLLVLWRWVWRPVVKMLDLRSQRIEQSLKDAARIEEETKALAAKRVEVMREAERGAQAIITEATQAAEVARQEATTQAHAEVEKILRDGKAKIATEKVRMVSDAKAELADLVVRATGKVLEESLDEKHHRVLAERVLRDINGLIVGK